ncbi:class I SAM-dependent methyltransferase [Mangrovibacterium lignilyticum]|uniref:class I SAM-dependent methyltransferase n=1 Tax=Mangrovibacterium lignilyticum TaxID=2668052 RepID=UPI0013D7C7A2|nr:class I SAM-dependent methyltransferase [Mangrovibacterium lignilyticum]
MIRFDRLDSKAPAFCEPRTLGLKEKALIAIVKSVPAGKMHFKLTYFQAFCDFLDILSLSLIDRNKLVESLQQGLTQKQEHRLMRSFLAMLYEYELIELQGDSFVFREPYSRLSSADFQQLSDWIETAESAFGQLPSFLHSKLKNVQLVNQLIRLYRNPGSSVNIPTGKSWWKMIANQQLDYEIRLAETLKHLLCLQLPHKISSPLDDSYYTESGRNAFQNFTKTRFQDCISEINSDHPVREVLDIGCGYGNYMDAVNQQLPEAHILGIELQHKVCEETRERFADSATIEVANQNVFDVELGTRVDLVLLNYVLFYFSNKQKEQLFKKLAGELNDSGSILICQYYAGIESLKDELKQKQGDAGVGQRIAAFFGDKILYANALWNEASDAFVQSEIWDEFLNVLHNTGFEVKSMTNADPFYYSLFVRIGKK